MGTSSEGRQEFRTNRHRLWRANHSPMTTSTLLTERSSAGFRSSECSGMDRKYFNKSATNPAKYFLRTRLSGVLGKGVASATNHRDVWTPHRHMRPVL